jgi:hypothetical protein
VLAESPIDALSWQVARALGGLASGPLTVASTDGLGALPWRQIVATQQDRGAVRVATDHDRSGERLWQELSGRYPSEETFGRLVRERAEARRQEAERRAQEREVNSHQAQERQRDQGQNRSGWEHDRCVWVRLLDWNALPPPLRGLWPLR